MIISVSFANEQVTERSYSRLAETIKANPCRVIVFDNMYPKNSIGFLKNLCMDKGFEYITMGENVGAFEAYNHLIDKADGENIILFDGDNYPMHDDWHVALEDVLGGDVVHSTLMNPVSKREMVERGSTFRIINGHFCKVTHTTVTCTTSAFSVKFLKSCGGLIGGNKYYGGNEIAMQKFYEGKKWVFLEDYTEGTDQIQHLHDWEYQQYKLLYAHKGLKLSFEEYLKTNPEKIENIEKYIWP